MVAKLPVPAMLQLPQKLSSLDKENLQPLIDYLSALSNSLLIEFNKRSPDKTPTNQVLVSSPKGNIYAVRVDDSGNITANVVYSHP